MKVLLVNAKPCLADALATCPGVEVALLWTRRHAFARLPKPKHVQVKFYDGGRKLNPRAIWQVRRFLHTERPDVAHAFYGRALTHVALAATGLPRRPRIVSFRGIASPLNRLDAGDWFSYRHPLVDAHACESDAVRRGLINSGIDTRKCWTVYNTMHNVPARRWEKSALAEFGIPAGAFVVGTMADIRPVKRIDLMLQAAIECTELEDIYWLLIGDVHDPLVEALAVDPRIRDRVRLVGHRPDSAELISGADVFVMPSRSEALCQSLLEAMYQGVCPVVSDAGGMKEVVRDGVDGLVVPSENAAALARAIRTLHADRKLAARFAASAATHIATSFTVEVMAERALAIYKRLLGANTALQAA